MATHDERRGDQHENQQADRRNEERHEERHEALGERRRIWAVTDGRAGNENPALGLAEAVALLWRAQGGADIDRLRLRYRRGRDWIPPRAWDLLGLAPALRALETPLPPDGAPPPDLVIGAGRRSAPVVAALKRRWPRLRAVQLLNPQMPLGRFDLVIAPAHDRLKGANLLATIGGLHRITADTITVRDPRIEALERPVIAALIGGPSRSAAVTPGDVETWLAGLTALGARARLAATTSRRTPPEIAARVEAVVRAQGGFFWDGARSDAGENPIFPLFGAASALVVTADSVTMASEACAAGKPVYIAPIAALSAKLTRFHRALEAGGHARPLAAALATADPFGWRPIPLADRDRAAAAVAALF